MGISNHRMHTYPILCHILDGGMYSVDSQQQQTRNGRLVGSTSVASHTPIPREHEIQSPACSTVEGIFKIQVDILYCLKTPAG